MGGNLRRQPNGVNRIVDEKNGFNKVLAKGAAGEKGGNKRGGGKQNASINDIRIRMNTVNP